MNRASGTSEMLADQFRRDLRARILRGDLSPGKALASERRLTGELGVSMARVRSILSALVHEGLIVRVQGRGTFVADPLPRHTRCQNIHVVSSSRYGDSIYSLVMEILHGLSQECESLSLTPQLHRMDTVADETGFNNLVAELEEAIGVVFLPFAEATPSDWSILPEILSGKGRPCVRVGWPGSSTLETERQVVEVNFDRRQMARVASQHAVSAGYERLAYIGPNIHRHNEQARLAGFIETIMANDLTIHTKCVVECPKDLDSVRQAVRALMKAKHRPEVICCSTVPVAGLALQALTEMQLSVPTDVALVGFVGYRTNIQHSAIGITSAIVPGVTCGKVAGQLLRDLMDGKSPREKLVMVEPELFVGESCPDKAPGPVDKSHGEEEEEFKC